MTHFWVEAIRLLDGQRQEGAVPGTAVLTPPLHPARGREGETLVVLLDLGNAPPPLARKTREAAIQAFWNTAGSVMNGLRQAVNAANRTLLKYNLEHLQEPVEGALSCVAIKSGELFLVQTGPSYAWAWHDGDLELFPRRDLPPLGSGPIPEVEASYLPIQTGDRLLLASQGLSKVVSQDAIRRVLSLPEEEAVLSSVEQVGAGSDFVALVMGWAEKEPLPQKKPAPPPPEPAQEVSPVGEEPAIGPPRPPSPIREEITVKATPPPEALVPQPPLPTFREEPPEMQEWVPEPIVRPARPPRPSLGQRARQGMIRVGRGLGGAWRWARDAGVRLWAGMRVIFRRTLPTRERRPRQRRERRPPPPENPRLLIPIIIAVLLLVILITAWAWFRYGNVVRRQQTLNQAQQYAELARTAATPDEQREYWQAVLATLGEMEQDTGAGILIAEAQSALDQLDSVTYVTATLAWAPNPAIRARSLVIHGNSAFLLDQDDQTVLKLTLEGERVAPGTETLVLAAGHSQDGQTVADLVDLAWNTPEGEWMLDRLVILDTSSLLWLYDPAWPEATASIPLGPAPGENGPVAVECFGGRLYLLDPLANQVWRYTPRSDGYPDPPTPYFATTAPQSLAGARDMAIDGNIYILLDTGDLFKYRDGEPAPFIPANIPPPAPHFAALTLDPSVDGGPVYLADLETERLIILDGEGNFQTQLRTDPGILHDPTAMALDPLGNRILILTNGYLYAIPIPELP